VPVSNSRRTAGRSGAYEVGRSVPARSAASGSREGRVARGRRARSERLHCNSPPCGRATARQEPAVFGSSVEPQPAQPSVRMRSGPGERTRPAANARTRGQDRCLGSAAHLGVVRLEVHGEDVEVTLASARATEVAPKITSADLLARPAGGEGAAARRSPARGVGRPKRARPPRVDSSWRSPRTAAARTKGRRRPGGEIARRRGALAACVAGRRRRGSIESADRRRASAPERHG